MAEMAISAAERDPKTGHFLPGWRGGPGFTREHRAERDAQQELASTFVEDLRDDWARHGAAVLEEVRVTKPDQYLRVITAVLPKTINLTGEVEVSVVGLLEQIQSTVVEGIAEVIEDDNDATLTAPEATQAPTDLPPMGDDLDDLLEGL